MLFTASNIINFKLITLDNNQHYEMVFTSNGTQWNSNEISITV